MSKQMLSVGVRRHALSLRSYLSILSTCLLFLGLLFVTHSFHTRAALQSATINVAAGGDLQAAINSAVPGDTIVLQAGATYTGTFTLTNKYGDGDITIRTSTADASLPSGVRVTPNDAFKLAKIVTPGNGQPAIRTEPAAHNYKLIGLEITSTRADSVVYEMVSLGTGGAEQDTLAEVPHHIIIDRCFIHGWANANFKRGVALNSAHTEILNSHISDFHSDYQDSQAIMGWNGPGPFKIINNRIEGAAENIMFGGATPAIYGLIPSNVEIRRNHLYKPRAWKPGEPGSTAYRPWIKNLFEIKNGQDFILDGNVMENNWYQADQHGTAVVLTPRSEGGAAPWVVVQRVTFTNNKIRNVGGGVSILGRDDGAPNDIASNNITFRNNLFENIRDDYSIDGSRVIQIMGGNNITFDHNTILHRNNFVRGYNAQTQGFVYTNNITRYGYGLMTYCGNNQVGLDCHFPGNTFQRNALIGAAPGQFVSLNYYPANEAEVGFVDYSGGNYRLAAGSSYKNAGTDGKDLGADIDAIETAYDGAPAPNPTPTPTPAPTPTPVPTPPSEWTFCADENQRCNFTGTRQVRYGAGGSYSTLTRTDGVECSNSVFGDPAFGVVKRCEVSNTVPTPTPTPNPTPTPAPTPTPSPTPSPSPAPTPPPTATPPVPPSSLSATASSVRIDLAWVDKSIDEHGFKIERAIDGVSFVQVATVAANVTRYTDTSVGKNRTYYYRVRAYNTTAGDSTYSNTANARTPRK